jgi:cysteine-rich repeat protein
VNRSIARSATILFAVACSEPSMLAPAATEHASALTEAQCLFFDVNGTDLICHATNSSSNPYVLIRVSENACVQAHANHPGDYVSVDDPTCNGSGCLPLNAPCDPLVPCCGGGLCSNGVCTDLCAGVTCTASDSCHEAGTCDPQTGICSNPAKDDGALCDDGVACSSGDSCSGGVCGGTPFTCPPPGPSDECRVGVCNGDGTCSLANAADGTSCCGPIPAELCGPVFHGSCVAGTCGNFVACGDGFIELELGESCDDGNTLDGDGCDASCQVEPFETTAPVKISGDLACTTAVANAARKIAVDGSGTIYTVMRCGATAQVAVSTDRGLSFSPPFELSTGLAPIAQVAVGTGPSGVAYVAMLVSGGNVFLRTTQDRGTTWGASALIGSGDNPGAGLSLESFNDDVYLGFAVLGGVAVARNHARGIGAFDTTLVTMGVVFFDLVYDIRFRTLAVGADTPDFHVRTSSDDGVSFGPEVNPPGIAFFSDWGIGNGQIFVSGITGGGVTDLFLIPASAPSTSTVVPGLPPTVPQARSVAGDAIGNAFVASQLGVAGVQLDRLAAGSFVFDAPRAIDPAGGSPIVTALPGGTGAAMVYTVGTEVFATIQAY